MQNDSLSIAAQKALADYLSVQHWDCWFTATSKRGEARRYPRQLIDMVSRSVPYPSKGFVGAERFHLGGWHAHGLVKFENESTYIRKSDTSGSSLATASLFKIQLRRSGYCRVEPILSAESVASYVAKYITKDLGADWDMWGWSRFHS